MNARSVSWSTRWGCSSVGRAQGWQSWGQGFEPPQLHQNLRDPQTRGSRSTRARLPCRLFAGRRGGIVSAYMPLRNDRPPRTAPAAPLQRLPYGSLGMDAESLKRGILTHLEYALAELPQHVDTAWEPYVALALAVRDRMVERWVRTQDTYYRRDAKRVYYLSLEYLMGRTLGNSLINMGLLDECATALHELGYRLEDARDALRYAGARLWHADRQYAPALGRAGRRGVRPPRVQRGRLHRGHRVARPLGEHLPGAVPERQRGRGSGAPARPGVLLRVGHAPGHPPALQEARRPPGRAGRGRRPRPLRGHGRHPAQRHPPRPRGAGADAGARRSRAPRLGRGVGDHPGNLRLHEPHRAPGGARAMAGGPDRRHAAPTSRDHLRDQPAPA